jgi:hypothetical protein
MAHGHVQVMHGHDHGDAVFVRHFADEPHDLDLIFKIQALVGSSSSSEGSWTRARAMQTFCNSPPLRLST